MSSPNNSPNHSQNNTNNEVKSIQPHWAAPANVHVYTSTRQGGVSSGAYQCLNLADHVGDDPLLVMENRNLWQASIEVPSALPWLSQVHSTCVVDAKEALSGILEADAQVTNEPEQACVIMTADCLPVVFASIHGDEVAAAHAGWRGLADGMLSNTLAAMQTNNSDICAWIGPAISQKHFEVGGDVYEAFVTKDVAYVKYFKVVDESHYLCDLSAIAKHELMSLGVSDVSGGDYCTYADDEHFFSYRRDGQCGRMATVIWFE